MTAPAAGADALEKILRERLAPAHVEIADESARHAGHPGADITAC